MSMATWAASYMASWFHLYIVDAGSAGPATLDVYTGTAPATPGDTPAGTLLATFTLNSPSVGSPTAGVVTWDMTGVSTTALATGTAGFYRISDSDLNGIWDGTVGLASAELIFDSVAWISGETITLTSGTTTQGLG